MSQYPMISIKNASIPEIQLIRELAMNVWPQTYTPIIGADQVNYILELFYTATSLQKQMAEPGHRFIICYSGSEPVAFAAWSPIAPAIYKLHKLYILPGHQGKGVGRFIIDHISGEIKKQGASALYLNVNIHNHSAKAFYEKTGFQHLRDEDIDIGNGYFMNDHVLVMNF